MAALPKQSLARNIPAVVKTTETERSGPAAGEEPQVGHGPERVPVNEIELIDPAAAQAL
jgi:hypothetical protein